MSTAQERVADHVRKALDEVQGGNPDTAEVYLQQALSVLEGSAQ